LKIFTLGAFLIPYSIFLVFGGVPILFLEVAIGQYYRNGGITVWQLICPFFKGIGYGTITVAFILNCYYIVIISWALLYLYYSFSWTLPWATCNNSWNSPNCWSPQSNQTIDSKSVNSVTEFWERKILQV
jgi:solute carrier family 6 GABA transporter-like protein 6/8/11/12/13